MVKNSTGKIVGYVVVAIVILYVVRGMIGMSMYQQQSEIQQQHLQQMQMN